MECCVNKPVLLQPRIFFFIHTNGGHLALYLHVFFNKLRNQIFKLLVSLTLCLNKSMQSVF